MKKLSEAQIWLLDWLTAEGWSTVRTEYQFCPDRKWAFDVAIVGHLRAIEIEGGAFTRGRHTRGAGFVKDMEKYNHATALGWRVFRFTPEQVLKGQAKEFLEKYL